MRGDCDESSIIFSPFSLAREIMLPKSPALEFQWIGIMAFVLSVRADSAASGSRQKVSRSISAKTGTALAVIIDVADAVKEKGEQTTSSPGPISRAIIAAVSAEVAEFTAME
jgi:hypothetical protein